MATFRRQNYSLFNPGAFLNVFNPNSYQGGFGNTMAGWFGGAFDYNNEDLYNAIVSELNATGNQEAIDFWNSLSKADQKAIAGNDKYTKEVEDWSNFWGLGGDAYETDTTDMITDIVAAAAMNRNMPTMPTREDAWKDIDKDPEVAQYLQELTESETRQTNLFQNQLQENQAMFDDYRSQLLGNQYQQNAQLMGSVDSAMSKARRNALEAGASAGLRMAENINTTLAMQNKQAQTSLETSNQLAQQLLNQRQAAAGIRSDYNQMLDNNVERRQSARRTAAEYKYNDLMKNYETEETKWNKYYDDAAVDNPVATYKKNQVYNSQYNQ